MRHNLNRIVNNVKSGKVLRFTMLDEGGIEYTALAVYNSNSKQFLVIYRNGNNNRKLMSDKEFFDFLKKNLIDYMYW